MKTFCAYRNKLIVSNRKKIHFLWNEYKRNKKWTVGFKLGDDNDNECLQLAAEAEFCN